MSKKYAAQGLSEYALAGVLIAIASIAAMTLLGTSAKTALEGMASATKSSQPVIAAADAASENQAGIGGQEAANPIINTPINQALTPGSLSGTTENFTQSLDTTGANGTTELLLAQMRSTIDDLVAKGEITPEQAASLNALEAQGHRIANLEKQIEDTVAQAGNSRSALDSAKFNFDGKNMDIVEATIAIGYSAHNGEGAEMIALNQLLADAKKNGALNNPKTNELISLLVERINIVGNSVETAVYNGRTGAFEISEIKNNYLGGGALTERYENGLSTYLPDTNISASTITHQDASTIGKAGKSNSKPKTKADD